VPEENGVGMTSGDFRDDFRWREGGEIGIEEFDRVAGVEEGATDAEEAEWGEVFTGDAAADGGVGWVEEEDVHALPWLCMAK
jgi:hypothetical protein